MSHRTEEIYAARKLSLGYPDAGCMAYEQEKERHSKYPDHKPKIDRLLTYLGRLVDLNKGANVVIVGCGTDPQTVEIFLEKGFHAVGIEPVDEYVQSARAYLQREEAVIKSGAEDIPLPDCSQQLVFCESVMEHVDSPIRGFQEMYRILVPGGVVYIETTNRLAFRFSGENGEFRVKYFNWLPPLIRECYIFHQLHYEPALAGWTKRPAVHWYCYSDLCRLGREAGFGQFYSVIDLLNRNDPAVSKSRLRQMMLNQVKYRPLLRALALTQMGNAIVMLKRPVE